MSMEAYEERQKEDPRSALSRYYFSLKEIEALAYQAERYANAAGTRAGQLAHEADLALIQLEDGKTFDEIWNSTTKSSPESSTDSSSTGS